MAIRLEHQPIGIGGLAAYAAGRGKKKERDRKYFTDIIQNQQARADKYNLAANQQKFQLDRDANQNFLADTRAVAQDRAATDRAALQAEERERERDEGRTYAEGRDALSVARSDFEDGRDYARKVAGDLPDISRLSPGDRKKLEPYINTINTLATSSYDVDEPDTGAGFQDAIKDFYSTYNAFEKPTLADDAASDTVYRDRSGAPYNEPGPIAHKPFAKLVPIAICVFGGHYERTLLIISIP